MKQKDTRRRLNECLKKVEIIDIETESVGDQERFSGEIKIKFVSKPKKQPLRTFKPGDRLDIEGVTGMITYMPLDPNKAYIVYLSDGKYFSLMPLECECVENITKEELDEYLKCKWTLAK